MIAMMKLLKFAVSLCLVCVFVPIVFGQYSQRGSFNNYNNQNAFPKASNSRTLGCPDKNGRYPTGACDAYIECVDGVAEEKLCPDGLLFNANSSFFGYPCQYPNEVDCKGRSSVQPAQPTEDCPHQFGLYKYGDARSCGQFKNCANGIAYIIDCPEGLAFNEDIYKCDWPDQVPSCDAEAYLGFSCPNARNNNPNEFGLGEEENRLYRSNSDCQQYFLCFSGRPRLLRCGEDEVFNEDIGSCEKIEGSTIRCSQQFKTRSQQFDTRPQQFNTRSQQFGSSPSQSGNRRSSYGNQNQRNYYDNNPAQSSKFQSFTAQPKSSYNQKRFY